MKLKLRSLVSMLLLLVATVICLWLFQRWGNEGEFLFMPSPPMPAHAINPQTWFPSMGGSRHTTFETNESIDSIQQFYRTELSKIGWLHKCTVTVSEDSCSGYYPLYGPVVLIDVYGNGAVGDRSKPTFFVEIRSNTTEIANKNWLVEISELLGRNISPLPTPISFIATPLPNPTNTLSPERALTP